MHTQTADLITGEALALPSETSALLALRSQQVIAHESGADTIYPLGSSWYVESLTNELEKKTREYLEKIDDLGGAVAAIERGYMQREIQNAPFIYQREIETKDRIIVGVDEFTSGDSPPGDILKVNPAIERHQVGAVACDFLDARERLFARPRHCARRGCGRGAPSASADYRRGARLRDARRNLRRDAPCLRRIPPLE